MHLVFCFVFPLNYPFSLLSSLSFCFSLFLSPSQTSLLPLSLSHIDYFFVTFLPLIHFSPSQVPLPPSHPNSFMISLGCIYSTTSLSFSFLPLKSPSSSLSLTLILLLYYLPLLLFSPSQVPLLLPPPSLSPPPIHLPRVRKAALQGGGGCLFHLVSGINSNYSSHKSVSMASPAFFVKFL